MADMNVTWKGAVAVDSWGGKVAELGGVLVVGDTAAQAAGFQVKPSETGVSAMGPDAVPYASTDEDFSWAEEYQASKIASEGPKRGRPKGR